MKFKETIHLFSSFGDFLISINFEIRIYLNIFKKSNRLVIHYDYFFIFGDHQYNDNQLNKDGY